jgi:peroxiredoxin
MELEALAEAVSEIAAAGATLVLISPQKIELNRKMMKEKGLSAVMLSDPGNDTAARYGLRYYLPEEVKAIYRKFGVKLEVFNEDDSWTLPLPARLIIDREGIIRHADISADYTLRPDPQETVAELKKIMNA